ncbi:phenylalanine--tRNA ligase subunit beta [Lyngbya sp. PCC 8106]|uniref:phenylalanine--tRNA ligase subunit beta n=1 Tax=Lyngbya sp. (strain PCC 8106) TaxID=313612 RepID=UPI0000EA9B75|nr:phenylalanine--tRNA ligase subunit beta [Lyngbya sp. PCC 8106]EAW37334.1 phenylalanyl-tRNA synthetase, beta subunit [Lyngbya sp. PCC 8106]
MRISLNWLRELVDIEMTPEQLAETLTIAGFEVEDIEDRSTWADGVVLGKILEATPHPNADKLRVCQVDIGNSEPLNIVCGAPNAKADLIVAVATIGTYLPQVDLKLKKTKLRGVPSEGMICSLAELGLEKDSDGIHAFNLENPQLGTDIRPLLGLDDVILDVTATANRADGLSMVGIAREIAALTAASLRIPEATGLLIEDKKASLKLAVDVSESQACPIYTGTIIEGIKIAPSPQWLKQRLQASGVRPINNVVDITNYIMLEWGQPLHAFDLDRLQKITASEDLTIGVRLGKSGESLKTLDSQTRKLKDETLLITANNQPIALAGIMGGEDSEVYEETQNLMLEAAVFSSVAIRRSARGQGLRTEASTRFERGVNPAELVLACCRAISLITELAGGVSTQQESASSVVDDVTSSQVPLRLSRINQILGSLKRGENTLVESFLQPEEVEGILTALGCGLMRQTPIKENKDVVWTVTVPAYRARDLEREIDLIEEVARLYGYDNFSDTLPHQSVPGYLTEDQLALRHLRAAFRAEGLTELMHYSLVKQEGENQVVISNPLFVEYSALRTEMLSGLIDAFAFNLENGNGPLNGFEIGRVFWKETETFQEKDAIAGIIGGDTTQGHWTRGGREQPITWFEAKGILEAIFKRLYLSVEYQKETKIKPLHPGRTASLWLNGNHLGVFGQLHPQLQEQRDLPKDVYLFEFNLSVLVEAMTQGDNLTRKFGSFSTFPPSDRDIAFFVAEEVSVADLEKCMIKAAGNLLESIKLFDEYKGEHVPEDQRSLAFRLVYRASDRTLTEEEVEPKQQKVREALVKQFNVNLRS